jgi:hypothetical protein
MNLHSFWIKVISIKTDTQLGISNSTHCVDYSRHYLIDIGPELIGRISCALGDSVGTSDKAVSSDSAPEGIQVAADFIDGLPSPEGALALPWLRPAAAIGQSIFVVYSLGAIEHFPRVLLRKRAPS